MPPARPQNSKSKKKPSPRRTPQRQMDQILPLLKKHYPAARCALHYTNPHELLFATILSAQCTDERVNMVTEVLFAEYPTPSRLAAAPVEEIEAIIRSTGFFRNKAKNLKACAQDLVDLYGEKVPKKMDQLVKLAGVGRKTANVVLGNAYGIASGVVVDTHVRRLSNRMGFVKEMDPVKIESKLGKLVPQEDWVMFSHWLIEHGRGLCSARKPLCEECFLASICAKRLS